MRVRSAIAALMVLAVLFRNQDWTVS
jgi:hypothetical protein